MFNTIRSRIIAWIGALFLLGLLTLVGLNAWMTYQGAKKTLLEHTMILAKGEADNVRMQLERAYENVQKLSEHAILVHQNPSPLSYALLSQLLRNRLEKEVNSTRSYFVFWEPGLAEKKDSKESAIHWYYDEHYRILHGSDAHEAYAQDFYTRTKTLKRPIIGKPSFQRGNRLPKSTITYPMFDGKHFLGVVGMELDLQKIQDDVAKNHPYGTGFMRLYAFDGSLVTTDQHVDQTTPSAKLPPDDSSMRLGQEDLTLPESARYAIRAGHTAHYASADGFEHVLLPIHIKNTPDIWSLRVSIPIQQALAENLETSRETLLVGFLILTIILALLAWLLQKILQPLTQLQHAMGDLSMGHGDLTQTLPVQSFDEIGQASDSFNRFIKALRSMLLDVRHHTQGLWKSVQALNIEVGHIRDSSGQQAREADAATTNIEHLAQGIGQIALASREAEMMARNASELSNQASFDVQATVQEIQHISQSVHELADILRHLETRSLQINSIVGVIKDIADQTNLLALNASIEATRAGGQGKSFSVVAEEVRKLAERTTRATHEISDMMNAVQQGIVQSVHNMQSALRQVDEGVKLSQKTSNSMERILNNAQNVVKHFEEISLTTAEQSSLSQQISRHVEHIDSMLKRSDSAMQYMQNNSNTLKALTHDLERLIARFRL
jgi:methyl-accepting chemotaxis protein